MYVNEEKKLVYVAHPKTASRSTTKALCDDHGFVSVRGHHMPEGSKALDMPGYTVFTTVRNHFDTLASWRYHERINREEVGDLDIPFVNHVFNMKKYYPDPHRLWALHSDYCDVILRYESLQDGLSNLLSESVNLPVLGKNTGRKGRHYSTMIDDATRAYIEGRFYVEMKDLGYTW